MGPDYFIHYAEANVVCILILFSILLSNRTYGTLQETQLYFNRTLLVHILYFTTDIGWAAVLGGQLPSVRPLVGALNLANYILLSLIAYEWFLYMAVSEKLSFASSRKLRFLWLLPLLVSVAGMLIAYAADPLFWISEAGELNSLYYPLQVAAPAVYLIIAFVFSLVNSAKAEKREDKKIYRLIGIYPLAVLLSGLFQVFWMNGLPIFCFGVTAMLLYFYIQHTQLLISADALTKLNNRGQIIRHMEQLRYRDNAEIYIVMLDVDRFKEINDTYGHAEGDRALVVVSEVLKQTCDRLRSSAFLGRYGGDEFTLILQNPEENERPERLTAEIRASLSEACRARRLPYVLEASFGFDKLRDRNDTPQACMIRADEKLYEDKQRIRG